MLKSNLRRNCLILFLFSESTKPRPRHNQYTAWHWDIPGAHCWSFFCMSDDCASENLRAIDTHFHHFDALSDRLKLHHYQKTKIELYTELINALGYTMVHLATQMSLGRFRKCCWQYGPYRVHFVHINLFLICKHPKLRPWTWLC